MEKPAYTVQQYKKFNGQTVMKALQSMDYHATTNKLAKYIAACIDRSEEDVKDTVKRVLSNAVANGFLVTRGKSYQLPSTVYAIQADSRKRSKQRKHKTMHLKSAPKPVAKARRKNATGNVNKTKLKTRK